MVGSSDSDSDDDKRVVRSAKDRRFDELKGTCEELRVSAQSLLLEKDFGNACGVASVYDHSMCCSLLHKIRNDSDPAVQCSTQSSCATELA